MKRLMSQRDRCRERGRVKRSPVVRSLLGQLPPMETHFGASTTLRELRRCRYHRGGQRVQISETENKEA